MAFAAASFGVTHYRSTGPRNAPAIVFVNSLGTDLRIWDEVAERLAPRYRSITYDKRGHGLSSAPHGPYSVAGLSADLLELADHLGLERFVLAGVSVGGMIAMRFAIDHPDRVASLVLCDTAARIGDAATWNARIDAVRQGGMEALADSVLLRWFPQSLRAGRSAALEGWRNLLLHSPVDGYVGTCEALRDADLTAELGYIAVPTLVVAGEADQSTPPDLVRATAGLIPGARFELVAAAGHLPSIDQPDELARLICEHLEATPAADRFNTGMRTRRAVLGDAHVDRAEASKTAFDADFQRFITEGAWGSVWSRPGLSRRERSLVTVALLAALGHDEEVAMHVRATANTGATPEDIREALLHVAVYAGVPAANRAFRIARKELEARP